MRSILRWVVCKCGGCWIEWRRREVCRKPSFWITGRGFCGRALAAWSEERAVRLEFIQPGQPVQNAHAESFNGRLCDECLNANWVHQPQRRKAKNRNLAARLQLPTPTQFVRLLAARRIC
ncbi:MAG: hypothetical protein DMG97_38025, partial [Acidobacteria bacterium]